MTNGRAWRRRYGLRTYRPKRRVITINAAANARSVRVEAVLASVDAEAFHGIDSCAVCQETRPVLAHEFL